jgi:hypothetical protein
MIKSQRYGTIFQRLFRHVHLSSSIDITLEFSLVGTQSRRERVIGSNRTVGGSSRERDSPDAPLRRGTPVHGSPGGPGGIGIERTGLLTLREADRLECEAWNAIMWAGGPAMPSPGEPQAEPTIGKAINGGYDLLEAKCNRCDRVSLVPLRSLKHPPETPVWKLGAAL